MFGKKPEEAPNVQVNSLEQIEQEIKEGENLGVNSTVLSPHEMYLLRKLGYEPLQVVLGNVVYSMGAKGLFRSVRGMFVRGEMIDFSRMNKDARNLALARAKVAAKAVGGDMIVSARIDTREMADFIEVICTATAVRRVSDPDLKDSPVVGI